MKPGIRALAVAAAALLLCSATPVRAQAPPPSQALAAKPRKELHGRLGMVGWTYSSIIRNGVVANFNLAHGTDVKGEDATVWRGLQLTGTVGRRGFEVGAGYARMMIAQIPYGYEFRGLAGHAWMDSGPLAAGDEYVGGEATFMFTILRFTGGAAVPIGADASHHPVLTGSIGVVWLITKPTKGK